MTTLRLSLATSSSSDLLAQVGGRDHEAFEELYRRFSRPILGLALRRLGDRGRAEDAVQEIFARVWRHAGTYRPERGPGSAWIYGIARHAIVDQVRRRRITESDVPELESLEPGPPEQAESAWTRWRLDLALSSLPVRQRELIELAYWSGLSQQEIADRLGLPIGTVKTRTRRALLRLAELLRDELGYSF
jgi:RNA polymerase sigma-70 factor, ECF subfamily